MKEIQAMTQIEDTLQGIDDQKVRDRSRRWACEKYFSKGGVPGYNSQKPASNRTGSRSKGSPKGTKTKKKRKTPSINKNLNLYPEGKKSFKDFSTSKQPHNRQERCVVSVYYLERVLEHSPIDASDVYTCFKDVGWIIPTDLENTLSWTASQKGWLDTRDMSNIVIAIPGENVIEHELPSVKESK